MPIFVTSFSSGSVDEAALTDKSKQTKNKMNITLWKNVEHDAVINPRNHPNCIFLVLDTYYGR